MQTPIRILHVDDDSYFTKVSKNILEVEGPFKVEIAPSVDEALTKIENGAFDVVLSDYYMPVKTGLDLLKALREKNSDIPFILFTGKGREEIIVQALNLGADRYIDKLGEPRVVYTELAVSICQLYEKAIAKKKLWESEERFKKMVTNSNDVIMLTENDGKILYLSPSCKQVLGYDPSELVGKMPWIIHPADLERVQKIFHRALTEKISDTAEYRIITKQGETRWVTHSYSHIIENSKINQIVSVVRDITERKKYEERLKESEAHFRLATKNSPIIMAMLDKDLRYTWHYNLRIKLPEGGLIGKGFGELLNIDNCNALRKSLQEMLKTGQPLKQEVTIYVQGVTFFLDCYFEPSRNDKNEIVGLHFVGYDITERKRTDDALAESEEKFSVAFNSNGVALALSRLTDGLLVEVNDCFLKTYGYTRAEIIGKTSTEINLYVDIHEREALVGLLQNKQAISNREVRTRKKDGAEVTVLASSKIINIKGQPHLLSTLIDISGLKKTEQTLFLRQKELDNFIAMAPDAVTIIDTEGRIADCNDIACQMFGYQKEEVIGKYGAEFVLEQNRNDLRKSLQVASKKGKVEKRVFVTKRPNGEKAILEGTVKTIRDQSGKPAAYLAITRDITNKIKQEQKIAQLLEKSKKRELKLRRLLSEHKDTLQKLGASEERYRFLAEHAEDVLAVTDVNGVFLYVSPSIKRLLGLLPEELIGKKSILQFISQDDFVRLNPKMETLVKKGELEPIEFCVKNSEGADVWLEVKISIVNDDSGEIRFLSIARDITQRKKDHEERNQALAHSQMLLEKLAVVGGLVRHDIKNKLSAVTCSLYLAKKYANNNPMMLQQIETVEVATGNITRILELAQTYQAVGDQGLSWIPLSKAVDEARSLLLNQKNVNVEVEGLTFEVFADSALVEIFHNLIENSLKYGQNLLCIKIHAEKKENSSLKIFYEDDGGGIDGQIKPRLFEKGVGIGSGLGLYLIQRICSVYGWKIKEQGIADIGVCFVLEIPDKSTRPVRKKSMDMVKLIGGPNRIRTGDLLHVKQMS